jgi:peptidoglycan L-alanyl-D-glutamate endopeptidase CwlK
VWAARSAGYPVVVTSGHRTAAEQRDLVAAGRSRTAHSKHLTGEAFDIDWYRWDRNAVPVEFWRLIGPWAERELGLVWGGRWVSPYDPGHFELP